MTTADRKRSNLSTLDAEPRQEARPARPTLLPAPLPAPATDTRFAAVLAGSGITLDGANPWDIRVRDERLFGRVLRQGALGLGEAYVDGWWDCDRLDEMVCRALRAGLHLKLPHPVLLGILKAVLAG